MGSGLQKPLETSLKSIHALCEKECSSFLLLENKAMPEEDQEEDQESDKAEVKRLRGLIKKYRYRTREAFASVLQETANQVRGGQLIAKHHKIPGHMKPDRVHVEVSMSQRHTHPNIDFEPFQTGPIVELKSTGQWWRLNHALQYQHVEQMVERAIVQGMHSLVISQSSTDQAEPQNSSLLNSDRLNDSPFVLSLKKLRDEVLQNSNITEKFLCVRVIGQHVNPRENEKYIVMTQLPNRDDANGRWDSFDSPTRLNELDILKINREIVHRCCNKNEKDIQEDIVYQILEAIQSKHEELGHTGSVESSMLATFSAPGRLSGGNGPGTYIRMVRNHTNWCEIIAVFFDFF